jgi:hypothetical protein
VNAPIRWRVYAHGGLIAAFPGHLASDAAEAAAYTWGILPGFQSEKLLVERWAGTTHIDTIHKPKAKAA